MAAMKDYEVTLIITGGEITFRVQANDESQAVDHAWNSLGEIPNLVDWNITADNRKYVVKELKPWSKEVRFPVKKALSWELYKENLELALIDAAALETVIPEEYADTWTGSVALGGDHFVVTLEGGNSQ